MPSLLLLPCCKSLLLCLVPWHRPVCLRIVPLRFGLQTGSCAVSTVWQGPHRAASTEQGTCFSCKSIQPLQTPGGSSPYHPVSSNHDLYNRKFMPRKMIPVNISPATEACMAGMDSLEQPQRICLIQVVACLGLSSSFSCCASVLPTGEAPVPPLRLY